MQKLDPLSNTLALDEDIDPAVTPIVGHVAKNIAPGLFGHSEAIGGDAIGDPRDNSTSACNANEQYDYAIHRRNPENIEWGPLIPGTRCYESVIVDDEEYFVSRAMMNLRHLVVDGKAFRLETPSRLRDRTPKARGSLKTTADH